MADFDVGALSGRIKINTQDVDRAAKKLGQMDKAFSKASGNVAKSERAKQQAISQSAKSTDRSTQAQVQNINAVTKARNKIEALNASAQNNSNITRQQQRAVARANGAFAQYRTAVKQSGSSSVQAAQANQTLQSTLNAANRQVKTNNTATQKASQSTQKLSVDTTDLSKSVQVALGPLSGVASRITALTSIFNRNNVALAATLGSFTAFAVAMQKSITVGAQLERQMMGLEAVIETIGDRTSVTATEINNMAQSLGRNTMTSAGQARQAFQIMLTSGISTRDMLEEGAVAAQGMASAFGRNLPNSARRLARVLQDPAENLNTLRRYGVQFTEQQKEQIRRMQRTGNVAGAQAEVMEELSAFTELATGESQGLAGAMDTLVENFRQAFENAGLYGGAVETLTGSGQRLADAIQRLSENEQVIQSIGRAFESVSTLIADSLSLVFENIELVIAATTSLFVGLIAGRVVALVTKLSGGIRTLGLSYQQLRGNIQGATKAMGAFNLVSKSIPIVAAITAAVSIFQAMKTEVDTINDSLSETGNRLQQIETRMSRIGANNNGIERLSQSFRVAESGIEATQSRIEELRSELNNVTGDRGSPLEGMSDRRDEIVQALQDERAELEDYRDMLKDIREDIDEFNERSREQQEILNRFDVSKTFLDDLQSQYSSTTSEIEEFRQEQQDLQALINRVDTSNAENAWQKFERATGMARNDLLRIQSVMEDENPAKEFSDNIEDTTNRISRMNNQLSAAARGMQGVFEREDIRIKAEQEVEGLAPQERANLAEQFGVQADNADALARNLAEVNRQEKNLSEAQDLFSGIGESRRNIEQVERALMRFEEEGTQAFENVRIEAEAQNEVLRLSGEQQQKLGDVLGVTSDKAGDIADAFAEFRKEAARAQEVQGVIEDLQNFEAENNIDAAVEQIEERFDRRREILKERYAEEEELLRQHLETLKREEQANKLEASVLGGNTDTIGEQREILENFTNIVNLSGDSLQSNIEAAQLGLQGTTGVLREVLGEQHDVYKRFAQTEALIAGALAVQRALSLPFPANLAASALIGAKTGAQIAKIESASFADGGQVRGPGTSRSDSIPAMLSDGEFVMNADATRRIGSGNLAAMNEGRQPMFQAGGPVGGSSGGGGIGTTVNIIDQRSSGERVDVEEGIDSQGNKEVRAIIKDSTRDNIQRGRHDRDMTARFAGIRRRGLRR